MFDVLSVDTGYEISTKVKVWSSSIMILELGYRSEIKKKKKKKKKNKKRIKINPSGWVHTKNN